MNELILRWGGSARASANRILLVALILSLTGVLIQMISTMHLHEDPYHFVGRQVRNVLGAGIVLGVAAGIGFTRVVQWSPILLGLTWIALLGLLLPNVAHVAGGSGRWYDLGAAKFQPSELTKVVLILFFAGYCDRRRAMLHSFRQGFLPAVSVLLGTALLVLMEPDFGQTVIILTLSAVVLLLNGVRAAHLVTVIALAVPVIVVAVSAKWEYFMNRISGYMEGTHYQVNQGLVYLSSGGLFGRGLGETRGQWFVPEIRNDFALVTLGEQGGFLACLCVALLFLFILHQGVRIALLAESMVGFSVALGLTLLIVMQAAVNMAVVADLVPPKGISLPFLSYGGSNMLVNGLALGLLVSVSRKARTPEEVLSERESVGSLPLRSSP
ncbi:MAG TPA: FtsW/RodA/SpoVE family cell cycle protein [Planctomycetota bacterium]|nr:FtsW/RodA/SpoVE family cell cycle protein [Planctomycetota bacterium]